MKGGAWGLEVEEVGGWRDSLGIIGVERGKVVFLGEGGGGWFSGGGEVVVVADGADGAVDVVVVGGGGVECFGDMEIGNRGC